ncbi:lactase-like protein isoform X3 [Dendrobates tinctorius]|uniref:lactase-like protein isoform X3 n=1 Tax=Dendrobates tinctorius TaxID=92724 RepID=UPI003CCA5E09
MITYFNDYANLCFEKFGDRVKYWITFSNPWAHARVWHSYDKHWRGKQKGMIGISLTTEWGEPVDISNQKDIEAAERFVQFNFGWFANPLYNGDYPQIMKEYIGQKSIQQGLGMSRLPIFTSQEKAYIKGTSDFLGVGHFTTRYITSRNFPSTQGPSYFTDRDLTELVDPKWPEPESKWLYSVPWGFRRLLNFVKTQYGNPLVLVTENGVSEKMQCAQLCDEWRIQYLKGYINEMLKDPLTSHMEMVTEIVVPTVCTLCILISAVLLMILLRRKN